jgi:hypothetical protein
MRYLMLLLMVCACQPVDTSADAATAAAEEVSLKPNEEVALRPPTQVEAEKIGKLCGVEVEYWDGLGRPPPEQLYQPVNATSKQSKCYFDKVRDLVTKDPSVKAE